MAYICQLIKGANKIDLTTGRYKLAPDFNPPLAAEMVYTSAGTSANRYGGESYIGSTATNQDWEFGVHVSGGSAVEIQRAINDLNYFLRQAGDENEPVYLKYRQTADYTYEPKWGQASRYYEIVSGGARYGDYYGTGNMLTRNVPNCRVLLQIKPYVQGQRQKVGIAKGGIMEDMIGSVDGKSRGLRIPLATATGGNKMTNPVFGNGVPLTDWSAGTNIVASINTNKEYVLLGKHSVKLLRIASADGQSFYAQSINAGNTNAHTLSCYAKKLDGSAVTASDIVLNYNGALADATYESRGNGWYRVSKGVTGVASAVNAGVSVSTLGVEIFVDGFLLEESALAGAPCYGDLLGCAWTGTFHQSTSTRAAASVKWASSDVIDLAQGTVVIAWRAQWAVGVYTSGARFWHDDSGLRFSINSAADGSVTLTDGTNTATASADAFSQGDVLIYHATWGPAGLVIYRAGVAVGSNATYAAPTASNYFWLGTSNETTLHSDGTYIAFYTFDRQLSASEVAADYASIYQLVSDNQRVNEIPWLWTDDGDGVLDKYVDATHENYAVAAGIPGNVPAITTWKIFSSTTDTPTTMCLNPSPTLYKPGYLFEDLGTGGTAYSGVGGSVHLSEIDTTWLTATESAGIASYYVDDYSPFFDKPIYLYTALADEGSGLYGRVSLKYGGATNIYYSQAQGLSCATALRDFLIGPVQSPGDFEKFYSWVEPPTYMSIGLNLKRSSASANVAIDYLQILPGYVCYLQTSGAALDTVYKVVKGRQAFGCLSTLRINEIIQVIGDEINLEPDMYNHLIVLNGTLGGASVITVTETVEAEVIPRWMIA